MATYAIGDIQGCFDSFQALLKSIHYKKDVDQLWFAGDMVNRGPKSFEVLEWIFHHQENVKVILGNHDLHLLFIHWGKRENKKGDTLNRLLEEPKAKIWIDWLAEQNFIHFENNKLLVHAGIHPEWDLEKIKQANEEAKISLQQRQHHPYFTVFTRMRYLNYKMEIEKEFSDSPENAPTELIPWYNLQRKLDSKITVLFGHWASLGIRSGKGWQSLDSGCVWGEKLSAFRLEDQQLFQVNYCG